jgi:DNA-binding IclR family transcriptional regulator
VLENNLSFYRPDGTRNPYTKANIYEYILDTSKKPSSVKSVFRAANILSCLSQGVYTITEISAVCQLNKATVHRLLKALVESKLAIQDPINHRYYLGLQLARMSASPFTTHEYLVTAAVQPMLKLSKITGETIFLSILLGVKEIILSDVPSKHDLRVVETMQKGYYATTGAGAKVLLSMLESHELKIALDNIDFEFPKTVGSNKNAVIAEVENIRRQGYCVTSGERIEGATCIAAPIKNYILPVALGILGPESRITTNVPTYVKAIKSAAAQFSKNVEKLYNT